MRRHAAARRQRLPPKNRSAASRLLLAAAASVHLYDSSADIPPLKAFGVTRQSADNRSTGRISGNVNYTWERSRCVSSWLPLTTRFRLEGTSATCCKEAIKIVYVSRSISESPCRKNTIFGVAFGFFLDRFVSAVKKAVQMLYRNGYTFAANVCCHFTKISIVSFVSHYCLLLAS